MAPPSTDVVGAEPIPELQQLGGQLARAREGAGLSLDALAQRLRVEGRLLKALETGDHSRLPEGVFVVALARRIAGSLGVNVDDAIAAVRQSRLMQHRPPGRTPPPGEDTPLRPRQPTQAPPLAAQRHRRPSAPPPPGTWRWGLAALLTASGAAAAWLLLAKAPSSVPTSPPPPGAVSTSKPSAPPPSPPQATPRLEGQGSGSAPPSEGAPISSPGSTSADTLRLMASEPSWVEVRDSRGRTLFEGTLSGEKTFPLGPGLEVIAGRPYAVSAAIGGAPASPLGGVDDIRWKRFTPGAVQPEGSPSSPPSP